MRTGADGRRDWPYWIINSRKCFITNGGRAAWACSKIVASSLLEKWFRDIMVYDIFEDTGNIERVVISKRIVAGLKAF